MKKEIEKVAEFLKENDCFCFLCHKGLDGDTLGACYALYYACLNLNKKAVVRTYEGEILKRFSFVYPEKEEHIENFSVEHYVSVDVADLKLLEDEFKEKKISLVIDHHETNKISSDLKCVDSLAAATCEIVYLILKEMGVKITTKIADCLYLGITTDTGSFKYQNVTTRTHMIAAELLKKGARSYFISFNAFDRKSKTRLNLEKEVIENLEYYFNDRCVIVFLTNEIVERTKATKEDCSSVSYIAASFEDAFFAITAREEEDGFKISLRTKGEYDASLFCSRFNGGGHKKAAGCFIKGSREDVLKKLLGALKEELKF